MILYQAEVSNPVLCHADKNSFCRAAWRRRAGPIGTGPGAKPTFYSAPPLAGVKGEGGMSSVRARASMRLPPEVNRALYVRNLPFKITAEEMYDIFGKFGAIRQIRLGNASDTRGTAFVVYEDIYDAKNAVDHLSGFNVCGRYLVRAAAPAAPPRAAAAAAAAPSHLCGGASLRMWRRLDLSAPDLARSGRALLPADQDAEAARHRARAKGARRDASQAGHRHGRRGVQPRQAVAGSLFTPVCLSALSRAPHAGLRCAPRHRGPGPGRAHGCRHIFSYLRVTCR